MAQRPGRGEWLGKSSRGPARQPNRPQFSESNGRLTSRFQQSSIKKFVADLDASLKVRPPKLLNGSSVQPSTVPAPPETTPTPPTTTSSASFRERLWALHLSGVGNDFDLNVGGKSTHVSKAVIVSVCEFFAQTISTDPTVRFFAIDNLRAELADGLVEFMYRGRSEVVNDRPEEFFAAAFALGIPDLFTTCVELMTRKLNKDNLVDFGLMALQFNESRLKDAVVRFMANSTDRLLGVFLSPKFLEIASQRANQLGPFMDLMREARERMR